MRRTPIMGRPACFACRARILLSASSRRYCSSSASVASKGTHLSDRRPSLANKTRLPSQPARTRFAPSPTGYLHLGSLRTALFNYLLARATNGQFLLRLEDTDQTRIVPDAEARLYEDLHWSGLTWDEGPDCGGPVGSYKQSERLPIYKEHADRLVREGKAFRCFCSQEDIASHNRKELEEDGTFGTYPGMCLSIPVDESDERAANGEAHTIRFKSSEKPPEVRDIIYGLYKKKLPEDHFIIMKSDGYPTYHFANVVDDHLMNITHVVRGAEWLISTAKHVSLYNAFNWDAPQFAHVGLLVDKNRQKLSKRNMDIGIDAYQGDGILPPALLNFAALLGWNPGSVPNKGVMTLDDMVRNFSLKFTKGDIVVNLEKLNFFQKRHIRLALDGPPSQRSVLYESLINPIIQKVQELEVQRQKLLADSSPRSSADPLALLGDLVINLTGPPGSENKQAHEQLLAILKISRSEPTTAGEAVEVNKFLIWQPSTHLIRQSFAELGAAIQHSFVGDAPTTPSGVLQFFIDALSQTQGWTEAGIHTCIDNKVNQVTFRADNNTTASGGYKYLRWALMGLSHGPQIGPLLVYLGKDETLRRLQLALSVAKEAEAA